MKSTYKLNSPPQKKRSKKLMAIFLILILIFGSGGGMILYTKHNNRKKAQAQQKARDEAQTDSAKRVVENNSSKSSEDTTGDSGTADKIPESTEFTLQITETGQANGTVTANARISNSSSEGTCVFTYTTTDDKPVIQQVSSTNSICTSSIPEVQFSKLGAWNLLVSFFANNKKVEATKSVTIN